MPESLRRILFFLPEALSVLLFAGVCFVAQTVPARLAGVSLPDEAKSVPVVAAVVFFFLQRQHCRGLSSSALPAALRTIARFNLTRLFIPAAVFVTTWYGIYLRGVTPTAAGLFGLAASVFTAWFVQGGFGSRRSSVRGTDVDSHAAANAKAERITWPNEIKLTWGALRLPEHLSERHFCVVGATGSGKTLTMRHLMQSVLPHVGANPDWRAVIYDAKRDILSLLSGMGLNSPVITFNPFDARSFAWDMARDLTDPAAARQIANRLIVKEPNEQNPFYTRAAQAVFAGILKSFMLTAPRKWTLRDALNVAASPTRLRKVLSATPHTRDVIEQFFEPQDTLKNTLQSIAAATATLEPVAALWDRCPPHRRLSLTEWLERRNEILVLGSDATYSETVNAINRVIFNRLKELVSNGPEPTTRRTWFFIDELKEAGNLDGLPSLISFGRSKGVRVAVAFQDIEGLRRPEVYGEKAANEMLGLFGNKSILRLDSDVTSAWASKGIIGEQLGREHTTSHTSGPQGGSSATTEHVFKREAVLASELLRLPPADGTSFDGYHVVPGIGVYFARTYYQHGLCSHGAEPNFLERRDGEQLLSPWNEDDERRLFGEDQPPPTEGNPGPTPDAPSPLSLISRMSRVTKPNES